METLKSLINNLIEKSTFKKNLFAFVIFSILSQNKSKINRSWLPFCRNFSYTCVSQTHKQKTNRFHKKIPFTHLQRAFCIACAIFVFCTCGGRFARLAPRSKKSRICEARRFFWAPQE